MACPTVHWIIAGRLCVIRGQTASNLDVRASLKSGYSRLRLQCPLSAISGHTAVHSISSSARESKLGGTVRPIALAAFILIASSYLTGSCTGRSAGFVPLRIRST